MRLRGLVSCLLVMLVAASYGQVRAQPSIPATFFGAVTVDGGPPPAGLRLQAFIGSIDCTQDGSGRVLDDGGRVVYVLVVVHESQKSGCGAPGREVTFRLGGIPATARGTWQPAPQEVNVDVRPPPGATFEAGASSPRPAQGLQPGSVATAVQEPRADTAEGDGGNAIGWLVLGIAVIAVAGAIAGGFAARRRKGSEKT